jgi:hypothetical protein
MTAKRKMKWRRPAYDPTAPYMDTIDAAHYLHRSPKALRKMRCQGLGPRFLKQARKVLYRRFDLDAWLEEQDQQHHRKVA